MNDQVESRNFFVRAVLLLKGFGYFLRIDHLVNEVQDELY